MKIAFVVHDYQRSGVGQTRYVRELARRFSKDHEVHVFANRIEGSEEPAVRFHHVPAWRWNAMTMLLSYAAVSTLMVRRSYDIVHTQGFCGFYGNMVTAHICNRAWHLALRKQAGADRVTLRERIFNGFATTFEFITYRWARRVIAVSSRVAEDIKRYYHCPAKIDVIHHAVDHAVFSEQARLQYRAQMRRKLDLRDSSFAFLYVGNLRKGAWQCIQALAKLEEGELICVSRTKSLPYRQLAEQLGVAGRVRFIDFTEHVETFYAAADALLAPSPYDAFAMVVTEAMACGLPVVVSKEAGASELIQSGTNGLLLDDVASAGQLAALMDSLQQNREWARQLGRAGQETALALTWDEVASRTLDVYQSVK